MRVDIITFLEVRHHLFHCGGSTLCLEFVETAPGTHLVAGSHENLEFRSGEHGSANITAVHDDTAVDAERMQTLIHPGTHERHG